MKGVNNLKETEAKNQVIVGCFSSALLIVIGCIQIITTPFTLVKITSLVIVILFSAIIGAILRGVYLKKSE